MSDLGPNMARTAQRLINAYGSTVTLTNVTVGAYDPATASASVATHSVVYKAVVASLGRELVDGKWVERRGARFTFSALSLDRAPQSGDRVTHAGATYLVEGVRPLYAGDTLVSYELIAGAT